MVVNEHPAVELTPEMVSNSKTYKSIFFIYIFMYYMSELLINKGRAQIYGPKIKQIIKQKAIKTEQHTIKFEEVTASIAI